MLSRGACNKRGCWLLPLMVFNVAKAPLFVKCLMDTSGFEVSNGLETKTKCPIDR